MEVWGQFSFKYDAQVCRFWCTLIAIESLVLADDRVIPHWFCAEASGVSTPPPSSGPAPDGNSNLATKSMTLTRELIKKFQGQHQ